RRIEGRLNADTPADTWRQSLPPTRLFRYEVQHAQHAWRLSEHVAPEYNRILVHDVRELVHEAFDGEHIVVRADATPESSWNCRRLHADIFDLEVWNVIRGVDGAIDGVDIDAFREG